MCKVCGVIQLVMLMSGLRGWALALCSVKNTRRNRTIFLKNVGDSMPFFWVIIYHFLKHKDKLQTNYLVNFNINELLTNC
jgi:hypothetical protein